ncbi:hypothetical protein Ccrd_013952 [Cynara cardunculus var. scolymus]|uniref:Uncharacterized protein n=1 Tax=Cynara cardunculus var. scolymus TaxID=59895 RepID=A0A103YEN5_CYNCS|nr:hypothetical protein Ccrd_013952 [Cynara cardunculus var. scolymus]
MAREIVREESNIPGKRSRLWISSEVYDVLNKNEGTEAVEVLHLLVREYYPKVHIDGKGFAQMKNLRILKIYDEELRHRWHAFDLKLWKESKVNYDGKLKFLSNKLRLLYWHGFPFKCFPSDFYPENIIAIDLSYSHIKNLWTSPKVDMRRGFGLDGGVQFLKLHGFQSWIHSKHRHRSWQKAKNFVTVSIGHDDDFEVKECGFRLVFDEDIEEETNFSLIQEFQTPTQEGGAIKMRRNNQHFNWLW